MPRAIFLGCRECLCPTGLPGILGGLPLSHNLGTALSPWCSEHLWGRLSLSVKSKFVCRLCNIYCSGLGKILENTGKKWLSFRFGDSAEGTSEGLQSLKLKDREGPPAPFLSTAMASRFLGFLTPQFLLKGAIYQTLCPACSGTPSFAQPSQAASSLALKLTLGPQT